jgi:threonine dehydrogenase-like Zn-dependent dehydrogenase
MKALTVQPGIADSLRLDDIPPPTPVDGELLVRGLALGICGTDREIIAAKYGIAPPGRDRLVLGHESLGRVEQAPAGSGFAAGDLVVGIVRRPDPVPCPNCAIGEWDMCRNGRYTEHGIKQLDGFGREWWCVDSAFAVKIDPTLGRLGVLLEPASVVAKAWEHTERIGERALWKPRQVLVTGAGPIGLLAALFATQRGLEVHVLDRATSGLKPELVDALGATYHTGSVDSLGLSPDVVMECTGAPAIVLEVIGRNAPNGIVCLAGVSAAGAKTLVDAGALNRTIVLENDVVFGSVNANRRHYEAAAKALASADRRWLEQLITRRVPLDCWREGFVPHTDDVKTILELAPSTTDGAGVTR